MIAGVLLARGGETGLRHRVMGGGLLMPVL